MHDPHMFVSFIFCLDLSPHPSSHPLQPSVSSAVAHIVTYLTDKQMLTNALWLLSGHLTGWLSGECLEKFGLFHWCASAGAGVSLLTDRLASPEVTFWQTLLSWNGTWPDILVICHETELLPCVRHWENLLCRHCDALASGLLLYKIACILTTFN